MLHFFNPPAKEFQTLTRDDPSAFAPPPAFGPFRVLHQVGVGTLGPVFRTYEPTRDRLVAVKVFRLDITPEQAQALADELSKPAEAGLFHPSIVEPIAAGVEGTSAYRADEYVAAETLDVAMRHYAPAPIEKVLPFIAQLAGAIDFARSAGIGHGALHPRDVFVTPEEARAGGFGVVEALEHVGLRAPVRRPYSAPERIAGNAWGAPADVFSLAVIAYELMTGRRPSGTGAQIAPVTGGAHGSAINAVIVRAMSDDPAKRYSSALAFASALDAASRGEGSEAPAPAAVASVPGDVDDTVDEVPAAVLDARAEPAEAELEEAEFRTSEPDFEEIEAVRRDDVAAPSSTSHRSLFDDDAAHEDLAIERVARDESERFADEFAAAASDLEELEQEDERQVAAPALTTPARRMPVSIASRDEEVEPAVAYAGAAPLSSYGEDPVVVREQRGIGFVPVAVTVVLALLVGFAAGYSVAGRAPSSVTSDAAATSGAPAPAPTPYSEQAVTPAPAPSEPPAPVSEVPSTSSTASPSPTEKPATRPAEPPAPTTGTVDVRSTPAGAGVTVDGRWRGRTPLTLSDLRFGDHVVRIVQPGFVTAHEEVSLSPTNPSRALSFRLQRTAPPPAPRPASRPPADTGAARSGSYAGSIYVDSRPRGARVLVDGKFMGTTPVRIPDIPIGSHVVRLQLEDHRDWTTSTRVAATQESRVTGSLERIR